MWAEGDLKPSPGGILKQALSSTLANFRVTRRVQHLIDEVSWSGSSGVGGLCFAHLPSGYETALVSVVGSDDPFGG